jgi:DNA invertase Pin-like site-specific DNA recombinase
MAYLSSLTAMRRLAFAPASHFPPRTPTAVLVHQVLGAVAQFDKATTVAKLAAARKQKRLAAGKCEGRKSHAETRPEAVALAKALSRKKPKGGKMSLRALMRTATHGANRRARWLPHCRHRLHCPISAGPGGVD